MTAIHDVTASSACRNHLRRSSSIELLRILAMLMIVASHVVMFHSADILTQPFGINKILIMHAAIAVFIGCAALDQLRGLLFRFAADSRRGTWSDALWNSCAGAARTVIRI